MRGQSILRPAGQMVDQGDGRSPKFADCQCGYFSLDSDGADETTETPRQPPTLCQRCVHILKYVILILIIPPFLNYAALQQEAQKLLPEGEWMQVCAKYPQTARHISQREWIVTFCHIFTVVDEKESPHSINIWDTCIAINVAPLHSVYQGLSYKSNFTLLAYLSKLAISACYLIWLTWWEFFCPPRWSLNISFSSECYCQCSMFSRNASRFLFTGQLYDIGFGQKLFLGCYGEGSPTGK